MSDFEDIKIASLDENASHPSGEGALQNIVLRLNQRAPAPWVQYFNHAWSQTFYMMKRRAMASYDRIEITCMPGELEAEHLPQLKQVIEATNKAYRELLERQERDNRLATEAEDRRKAELAALKERIKLD